MAGGPEGEKADTIISQFIKGKKGGGSQHHPNISGRTPGAWSLPIVGREGREVSGDGAGGGTGCTVFLSLWQVS